MSRFRVMPRLVRAIVPCSSCAVLYAARCLPYQVDAGAMESLRDAASELLPRVDAGGQTAA